MPDLAGIVDACAAGALPPPVAAMRLLMAAPTPEAARTALARGLAEAPAPPLSRLAALLDEHPDAWARVHGIVDAVAHAAPEGDPVAHWAALFDRAVEVSPEGSVALYSLGSPDLLAQATAEVADWLVGQGLAGPGARILDVGCGIGRLGAALSPRVAEVIGLDVSPGMIAQARRRCAGLANLRFAVGSGRDLAGIADGSVDLVAFVDSFPYLVLSGGDLAARHVAEAARVLRPGGRVAILNLSYRGSLDADQADLARYAAAAGLVGAGFDERPFRGWDAPAFVLARA
jgi:SAM-dependent methyltransferase